ncbi:MAG: branched-chain amino acid ABC transporter permease [Thermoleophilia bacterium]
MGLRNVRALVPLVAAVLIGIVPLVVSDRFLLKIFTFAGINVLVIIGLALLFGHAGQVSLGHAAFVGVGAYTCAYCTVKMEWPWLLSFALAGLLAALGGLVLALPSLRLKGHYLAMATLSFGLLMTLAFAEAQFITGGVDGFGGIPFPSVGPLEIRQASSLYWLVWGVIGVALLGAFNLTSLRPGRAMRALHGSELGAQACGVDIVGVKVRTFVVSALLAGFAGALYASVVGFISPSVFTLNASIAFLAMAVVGGSGSLAGPIVAAILLTLVQYLDALIPGIPRDTAQTLQSYQEDIYGLAIVLVVIFAPGGLASVWRRRFGKGSAQ